MSVRCLNCGNVITDKDGDYWKCPTCNAIFHKVIFRNEEQIPEEEVEDWVANPT